MPKKMARLRFSVSPAMAKRYELLAEQEGITKSNLFCRMMHAYKAEREEQDFFSLQRKMTRRARKSGVLTEEDVERIVFGSARRCAR
jgi:hypothetical protein